MKQHIFFWFLETMQEARPSVKGIQKLGDGESYVMTHFRHPSIHPIPGAWAVRAYAERGTLSHLPHIILYLVMCTLLF